MGRGLADLSALEAQGGDERQAPDPRRHRRRRQGRQDDRLRRPPALPDRLRVLQRRRARRPGARPDVPQGHRRRRQGRRPRARAQRPRLGRHAPHRPTASCSTRAGRSTSRKARSTTRRSRRPTARRCAAPTPASSATSRGRRSSRSTSRYGFANPHGHVFDRWGQDIVIDGTGANPYHAALVLRPPRLSRRSTPGRRRSTSSAPAPAPASRSSPAGTSPTRCRATCWSPTSSASRASCSTRSSDKDASFAGTRGRADRLLDRPELPPVRPRDRARTARSTSSTGRTRSSATCSTTSAIRAATATHGRIYRVTYEGRPLLKPAKIAGEPIEKLLDLLKEPEDRVRYRAKIELGGRKTDEVIAAVEEVGRRPRHEGPRATSTTCWKPSGCTSTTTSSNVDLLEAAARARPTSAPGPRPRACSATGATACPMRSSCSRSWPPTSIRASGSKRSAPPASSRSPRRSRSPLIAAEQPSDYYLDFTRGETMQALEPLREEGHRRGAADRVHQRRRGPVTSSATSSTDDLLKMKRSRGVLPGTALPQGRPRRVPPRRRWPTWPGSTARAEPSVLIDAIREPGQPAGRPRTRASCSTWSGCSPTAAPPSWPRSAASWSGWRPSAKLPVTRQLGFVALIAADG